jgi:serine/threonine protein kinase
MASMTQIGRYEVKRKTGSHGTAALYEAFDPVMNRPVTIRITEGESDDSGAGEESSGNAPFDPHQMAGLDHPNIIRVLACEEDGARPYLVMEQFEGKPLSAVLSEQPNLDQNKVSQILKSAASALDHVHSKGLIHNHLTPDSIVLSEDGLMKVAGFEVACLPEHAYSEHADREYPAEAIPYLPPEFLKGEKLDHRSDQFSLAAIAFYALTGTRPFQAASAVGLLRQVMFEKPMLGKLRDKYSLTVVKVFETALSGTPAARHASCSEFAAALEAAITVKEAAATRLATEMPAPRRADPVPVPTSAPASPGSSRWLVWIVGLVLVAGLVALGVKLFSPTPVVVPAPPPKSVVSEPVNAPAPVPATAKAVPETKPAKPKVPKDKTPAKTADKSSKTSVTNSPDTTATPAAATRQPTQEKAAPAAIPAPAEQPPPPAKQRPTLLEPKTR